MIPLWDASARDRLVAFAVGLGCGSIFLFMPPKIDTKVMKETLVVTKTVEVQKDVVKWRDRVTTITRPGEVITIVDKSGEQDHTKIEENNKTEQGKETLISYKSRYTLGVFAMYPDRAGVELGARVGNLPFFLTASAGTVSLSGKVEPMVTIGVRYEW